MIYKNEGLLKLIHMIINVFVSNEMIIFFYQGLKHFYIVSYLNKRINKFAASYISV